MRNCPLSLHDNRPHLHSRCDAVERRKRISSSKYKHIWKEDIEKGEKGDSNIDTIKPEHFHCDDISKVTSYISKCVLPKVSDDIALGGVLANVVFCFLWNQQDFISSAEKQKGFGSLPRS
jgi:hypothetical protein